VEARLSERKNHPKKRGLKERKKKDSSRLRSGRRHPRKKESDKDRVEKGWETGGFGRLGAAIGQTCLV